jgi:CBS domain-containing protein
MVAEELSDRRPVDLAFGLLSRRLPEGACEKIRQALPEDIRRLWLSPAARPDQAKEEIMQIRDIMTRGAQIIDPDATLVEAARRMRAEGFGALPVGENDRLVGMVTDRDIVMRAVAEDCDPGDTLVREVMSQGVCYCFEDEDAEDAGAMMADHQVRRLPVLNRNKRLVGIVSLADLGLDAAGPAATALRGISIPSDYARA